MNRLLKYVWILHLGIAVYYIIVVLSNVYNIPHSLDDINFFLHQTKGKFLNPSRDIIGQIKYFFLMGNWPHPKITGRVLALASYYGLGEINFKFLILVGHLFILGLWSTTLRLSKLKFGMEALPITLVMLIPAANMINWPVSILGFVPHLFYALLTYHFLYQKKYIWFGVFSFLTTFSSGPGFLVLLPAIFLFLLDAKTRFTRQNLIAGIAFVVLFLVFAELTIDWRFVRGSGGGIYRRETLSVLGQIARVVFYGVSFTVNIVGRVLNLNSLILLILGALTVLLQLRFLFFDIKNSSLGKTFIFHAMCLYIIGIGFIAGIVRQKDFLFIQDPLPRYEIYSSVFLCSFLAIILIHSRHFRQGDITRIFLTVLTGFIFIWNVIWSNTDFENRESFRLNAYKNLIVEKQKGRHMLSRFIEGGYYNPPNDYINPLVSVKEYQPDSSIESFEESNVIFEFKRLERFGRLIIHSDGIRAFSYDVLIEHDSSYYILMPYRQPDNNNFRNKQVELIDFQELNQLEGSVRFGVQLWGRNGERKAIYMSESESEL